MTKQLMIYQRVLSSNSTGGTREIKDLEAYPAILTYFRLDSRLDYSSLERVAPDRARSPAFRALQYNPNSNLKYAKDVGYVSKSLISMVPPVGLEPTTL